MIVDRRGARAMWSPAGQCHREDVEVCTSPGLAFVDITAQVAAIVERSGIAEGLVSVQSLHTTAAVVVNENEPLLLHDLRSALERAAPRHLPYRHDDFAQRAAVAPDEPANGHAHCQALFLRASETLGVADGRPRLGRWQSIFLVELDGPRTRTLAVTVLGT
jgi:secondary thiamine-phosphate synthase enzyme